LCTGGAIASYHHHELDDAAFAGPIVAGGRLATRLAMARLMFEGETDPPNANAILGQDQQAGFASI